MAEETPESPGDLIAKIVAALEKLAEQLKGEPEDRDEAAVQESLRSVTGLLAKAPKGFGPTDELTRQVKQLRADMDHQAGELRRVNRMGLGVRGGQVIVPGGLRARREMLKDGRAFLTDDMAIRFGGYALTALFKAHNHSDIPKPALDVYKSVCKDWDISVGASGEYLIPDEFKAELIRNVIAEGTLWPMCRQMPLATMQKTYVPVRTGGLTAYHTAASAQGTRSTPTFELKELSPEKLMALTAWPNEFNRSAQLAAIGQLIGTEFAYAMAYAIDNDLVNGDGSATYGGITGLLQSANITAVAAAATHTTLATLDWTDLTSYVAGLTKDYALKDAQWSMHLSSLMTGFVAMQTTTGAPVLFAGASAQIPANLGGYPFTLCNRMTAAASVSAGVKFGIFGDLRKSHVVGLIQDIIIGSSEFPLYESDMTVARGLMHFDIVEADANAVVTVKTAAS